MSLRTALGLLLAVISTTLTNTAYSIEHDAAAALPALSLRRPIHSLHLLLNDRSWMAGFAMETAGFICYAAALGLASLAVVQSIGAGGIGVLAYVSARRAHRQLERHQMAGVICSMLGLVALGISLTKSSGQGQPGKLSDILAWIGGTIAVALLVLLIARRRGNLAVAYGVAGGLFFSVGDFSTKIATQGGVRIAFVITAIIGYLLGTTFIQMGYQQGSALTVAGLATLLTNALPILAGTIVLKEPVPTGVLGAVRIFAYVAVVVGAVLLSAPDPQKSVSAGSGAQPEPQATG